MMPKLFKGNIKAELTALEYIVKNSNRLKKENGVLGAVLLHRFLKEKKLYKGVD